MRLGSNWVRRGWAEPRAASPACRRVAAGPPHDARDRPFMPVAAPPHLHFLPTRAAGPLHLLMTHATGLRCPLPRHPISISSRRAPRPSSVTRPLGLRCPLPRRRISSRRARPTPNARAGLDNAPVDHPFSAIGLLNVWWLVIAPLADLAGSSGAKPRCVSGGAGPVGEVRQSNSGIRRSRAQLRGGREPKFPARPGRPGPVGRAPRAGRGALRRGPHTAL